MSLDGLRSDYLRKAPRRRRAAPTPEPPETLTERALTWKCPYTLSTGQPCTRTVGPYHSKKLLTSAIQQHLGAQHVSESAAMRHPDMADLRIRTALSPSAGYDAPTW